MIFREYSDIVENDILITQRFLDVSRFLYFGGWLVGNLEFYGQMLRMKHQIIAQEFPWEHAGCWLLFVPAFPITNNKTRVMAPKNLTGGDKKHFFFFIFAWPYFFIFFNRVIVF